MKLGEKIIFLVASVLIVLLYLAFMATEPKKEQPKTIKLNCTPVEE